MKTLVHKMSGVSDFGIRIKSELLSGEKLICYSHSDDYYSFGLIKDGGCHISIDFNEYRCRSGEIVCIKPGQVHSVISSTSLTGFLLLVDGALISETSKSVIDEATLHNAIFQLTESYCCQLYPLFQIISERFNLANDMNKDIMQGLVKAVIGIISEAIQNNESKIEISRKKRYVKIVLDFRNLLENNIQTYKSPSWYADRMNISLVYLNEAVKAITGNNVSKNIQSELVLRAKRKILYTSGSIKEISEELGFEDSAYFTRLFTKVVGLSPTQFRNKYLE